MPPPAPQPQPAPSWRQQALAHEAARDLPAALDAWQHALTEAPHSLDIARHLADLAFRLNMWEMAEKLLAHLINHGVRDTATLTAFAATLREQSLFDDATELLKTLLGQHPEDSALWEGLGAVMAAKGDADNALIFFGEALRLDPDNFHARFNRGCALMDKGDMRSGLTDAIACVDAFRDPDNRRSAQMACAHAALALGDLKAGWRWFEARHKSGSQSEVHYDLPLAKLDPTANLKDRKLFIACEQGLGDEVLFGSLLPDIAAALGDNGHLGIGVEPRLVPLFARSFPDATVAGHCTRTVDGRITRDYPNLNTAPFDACALVGDFLPRLRPTIERFSPARPFLTPAPPAVAHWRQWLATLPQGPKVGILWKSLKSNATRDRYFAPFHQWAELLTVPGITFINLQYGDSSAEQAALAEAGLALHTPDIDLKDDLDGLAALTSALDIVVGPSNATTNIAAACGVETWLLGLDKAWLKLGADGYPWYLKVRYFSAPAAGHWAPAMTEIRNALITKS